MNIKINELKDLVMESMGKKYDKEDSSLMTDIVLFGEMSGRFTHGLVRLLVGASILRAEPKRKPEIKKITKLSSLIVGNGNPGMLVGTMAMNEVIKIAKENDFGMVGTRGSVSSSGCLTYYLEKIANEGLVGIIMAESPRSTSPYGGIEPLFGTNPIAFGYPTTKRPLIFDMGTSAITFGELLNAKTLGKKIPAGVALDNKGNVTIDPEKAIEGATLPFDNSYKGAGLAMMVEILSGAFPHSGYAGIDEDRGWGNLFIAFSPKLLSDVEDFKDRMTKMVERIRNSNTKDGSKVRIPGEKTLDTRDLNLEKGKIEIEDKIYELLLDSVK
jgi:LDH2 family malate/lactate/ureidoglycolate dehydrogenase